MERRIQELVELRASCPEPPSIGGELGAFLASLISRRHKPVVAYLGPEKSFTWEAASSYMPGASLVPARTIGEVFAMVEGGSADLGVVPFMNSLEGPVGETVDSLATRNVRISAVLEMRIVLCFAKRGTPRVVYSHPHAIAQARRLLSSLGAQVVYTNSTAEAVKAFETCTDCGVLASPRALVGFEAQCGVEDAESYTRFAVISPAGSGGGRYAALIFAVPNTPGSLYRALEPIAAAGVNMSLIYSRPTRLSPWDYFFLVELEVGDGLDGLVSALRGRTTLLKVVGRYDVVRL
ncbi:prephenate dehydratase [Thermoproteus uzoniensis]